ncbi:DNA polymerase alpha-associated DNA helicase A [Hamiltosporidium tvaerminnensis]|uniref:DNA polymerase alpha-associated DNA helicase A n=1 Tax=Hamiltosporidium tvaerminnensis TaxID=1176355 RepID=A0A4Q9LUW6_9MICR|nr:DNA polymerase alpha-associated DNA helicase A [Hamiltosporidium tvaerminnensis]
MDILQKYVDSLIFTLQKELEYLENEDSILNIYKAKIIDRKVFQFGNIISFKIIGAYNSNKTVITKKLSINKIFKEEENIKIFFHLENTYDGIKTKIICVEKDVFTCLTSTELKCREVYVRLEGSVYNTYRILKRLKKIEIENIYFDENILSDLRIKCKSEDTKIEQNNKEIVDFNEDLKLKELNFFENIMDKFQNLEIQNENENFGKILDELGDLINYTKLNKNQQRSLIFCTKNISYRIIGPPGTGKTKTVVEIIKILLTMDKSVLVCGPSNLSVDNILSCFVESEYHKKNKTSLFRLGSISKSLKTLNCYNLDKIASESVSFISEELNEAMKCKKIDKRKITEIMKEMKSRKNKFSKEKIKATNLVFSTLFSSHKIEGLKCFDWIIIDEACQALEAESFLNILLAKNFILVGDPYQLGPTVKSESKELKMTFFDKLKNVPTFFLNEQYRMNEILISFSNSYFYSNQIISPLKNNFKFFSHSPILFIDTSGYNSDEMKSNSSIKNIFEAEITLKVVKYLESIDNKHDVGIITPYSQQAIHIKEIMPQISFPIQISTVDAFQGQEKGIIILNLVRSNEIQDIGFLSDLKRINVALTRCIHGLVIIGDSSNFAKYQFYKKFFDHLYLHAYCIDPYILDALLETN